MLASCPVVHLQFHICFMYLGLEGLVIFINKQYSDCSLITWCRLCVLQICGVLRTCQEAKQKFTVVNTGCIYDCKSHDLHHKGGLYLGLSFNAGKFPEAVSSRQKLAENMLFMNSHGHANK